MGSTYPYPWCKGQTQPGNQFFIIAERKRGIQNSLSISMMPAGQDYPCKHSLNIGSDYAKLAPTQVSAVLLPFPRILHGKDTAGKMVMMV